MKQFLPSPLSLALAVALLSPGGAARAEQRPTDQDGAFKATQRGLARPLPEIEAKVLPQMAGARYLGPEYDAESGRYRLKFMRAGSVIWVDVDGRTGRLLGQTGR